MSISNISSATNPFLTSMQSGIKQRNSDFSALGQTLNTGDLSGAQQAFAALQQTMTHGHHHHHHGGGVQNSTQSASLTSTGSDSDNDGLIGDAGEAFGAYLTVDQPVSIHISQDTANLDFTTGFEPSLPFSLGAGHGSAGIKLQRRGSRTLERKP